MLSSHLSGEGIYPVLSSVTIISLILACFVYIAL